MLVLGAVVTETDWLDGLELTARERDVALACAGARVPADRTASGLWRAWHAVPVEAVAVAGARGERARRVVVDRRRCATCALKSTATT